MVEIEKIEEEISKIAYSEEALLEFSKVALTFKYRPSDFVQIQDATKAFAFDVACRRQYLKSINQKIRV